MSISVVRKIRLEGKTKEAKERRDRVSPRDLEA